MGFNILEWFVQESLKFDLFLDTKTLIAPIKLKQESSVLKFCLLLDISFYGCAEGTNLHSPHFIQYLVLVFPRILKILPFIGH